MKCARLIYGLGSIVILVSLAGTALAQEVAPESSVLEANRAEFFSRFAVADYDAPLLDSPEALEQRRLKNQRYDKQNWVVKNPPPDTDYSRRSIIPSPLPVFPIEESDLIVTGITTAVSAHLSNDKTGVYSEYTIRVEQVLKDGPARNLTPTSVITVDRAGGAVRYSDDRRIAYFIAEKKLPLVGANYALFLRDDRKSKNFEIVTLYELKPNRIIPLDHGGFDELKGMTKSDFIKAIQEKLSKRPDD